MHAQGWHVRLNSDSSKVSIAWIACTVVIVEFDSASWCCRGAANQQQRGLLPSRWLHQRQVHFPLLIVVKFLATTVNYMYAKKTKKHRGGKRRMNVVAEQRNAFK